MKKHAPESNLVNTLPQDVLLLTLMRLNPISLAKFSQSSTQHKAIADNESLWEFNTQYYFKMILNDVRLQDVVKDKKGKEKFKAIYQALFLNHKNEKLFQDLLFKNQSQISTDSLTQIKDKLGYPIAIYLFLHGHTNKLNENDKITILSSVIKNGNYSLFTFLIEDPEFAYLKDLHIYNIPGLGILPVSALEYATFCGQTQMVEQFLISQNKKIKDVLIGKENTAETAGLILCAAISGKVETLKWLEKKYNEENNNNSDKDFQTFLTATTLSPKISTGLSTYHIAAASLNTEMMRYLIFQKNIHPFTDWNLPIAPLKIFRRSLFKYKKTAEEMNQIIDELFKLIDDIHEQEQKNNSGASNNTLEFLKYYRDCFVEYLLSSSASTHNLSETIASNTHNRLKQYIANINRQEPATLEIQYPITMRKLVVGVSGVGVSVGLIGASIFAVALLIYVLVTKNMSTIGQLLLAGTCGGVGLALICGCYALAYSKFSTTNLGQRLSEKIQGKIQNTFDHHPSQQHSYQLIEESISEFDIEAQEEIPLETLSKNDEEKIDNGHLRVTTTHDQSSDESCSEEEIPLTFKGRQFRLMPPPKNEKVDESPSNVESNENKFEV